MARRRVSAEDTVLKSWDECDAAVREIGEHDARIASAEAKLTKTINELREQAESTIRPWKENRKRLDREVREFCEVRRADFEGRKSRELNFGTVGWRRSTTVRVKKVAETIKELKSRAMHRFIRTKESVNKDALHELSDDVLKQIGAARKVEDKFFVDPDTSKIHVLEG